LITNRDRQEHFTGSASEHFAASIFLRNGIQVFWPALQQGAIDFVILEDTGFKRVQVKTATWIKSGNFKYLQVRTRLTKFHQDYSPKESYDLLVIVAPDKRVWAIPAETVTSSNLCLDGNCPNNSKRKKWTKFIISD